MMLARCLHDAVLVMMMLVEGQITMMLLELMLS
jgi:hypothetical protein